MKFEWEIIFSNPGNSGSETARARVFGGWIVNNETWDGEKDSVSESSVFIPDSDHKWTIVRQIAQQTLIPDAEERN